ncbi:MAG: sodium:proton exchanger [Akkermansiaceae bacterium]|nr:sodium:proton exchanger [Akkermansiaceae bacterium]
MIFTLVIGLTLALVLGMLAQKLKLSPLVGYLVAGMLAAQPWWGEPVDAHIVEDFSHIGVVLLLFGVGLQFHIKDLLAVQKVAVPGALVCMLTVSLLGMLAFHFLGMGDVAWVNSLMFGLCVCVSSTVVLTRVLGDNRVLQTPTGHTALGWLVVEDMFTIILLVLLPAVFGGQELGPALGMMAVKLTLLVVVVALFGRKVIKQVLTYISRYCSDELFTLAVLVCALGIAVLSATVFNASMEFGAFLSGMVVGQSKFASRAASDALPMRDAFAVLFFVSVGMGFHIGGLLEHWPLALATLAICMLAKPIMAAIMVSLLGKPMRLSLMVGGSLSQIGEFSFILATLIAGTYKLLPMEAVNVITGVAIVSITLNAALYRFVPLAVHKLEDRGIGTQHAHADSIPAAADDVYRILLVGYGPCGELVSQVLRRHDMEVVVLEMNVDTVARLHKEGLPAIHGDASNRTILRLAGVEKAKAIIISSAAAPAMPIASAARSLNPDIRVVAHTNYIRIAQAIAQSGDAHAFAGEAEVALAMTSHMLRSLGATEEQVMRECGENRRRLMGENA